MILEICANSYRSALVAQKAGAHRIELCVDLDVGGLTPSYGLIKKVVQDLSIPVFVLIRPRKGNFTYSDNEFDMMVTDLKMAKKIGCSGIVSGILNQDYSIDIKRTKDLIELANPLPFTFHRAFDLITDAKKAVLELIDIGADRLLSSGQEYYAQVGIPLLKELKMLANNKLIIIPGGGINPTNAQLFKNEGFNEIHAAALSPKVELTPDKINHEESKMFEDDMMRYSDEALIRSILKEIGNEA